MHGKTQIDRYHRITSSAVALLLAFATPACKRSPPYSSDPRAPPPGPRFCDQDLSGVWVNASDARYAYRLRDKGEVVEGLFFHRLTDGTAGAPEQAEEPLTIELHRSAQALSGLMRSFDRTPKGARCPVEFGLRVSSCSAGSLQILVETSYPIAEDCSRERLADGGDPPRAISEYIWDRAPSPASAPPDASATAPPDASASAPPDGGAR